MLTESVTELTAPYRVDVFQEGHKKFLAFDFSRDVTDLMVVEGSQRAYVPYVKKRSGGETRELAFFGHQHHDDFIREVIASGAAYKRPLLRKWFELERPTFGTTYVLFFTHPDSRDADFAFSTSADAVREKGLELVVVKLGLEVK